MVILPTHMSILPTTALVAKATGWGVLLGHSLPQHSPAFL